jgi:hypothetical protein
MKVEDAFIPALQNIADHGDTDILPLPFETYLFADEQAKSREILKDLHDNLDARLAANPPQIIPTLAQVGYTGFRWATFIEPFWNAYYLSLAISVAGQIEEARISGDKNMVFSYRFGLADGSSKLFTESNWMRFRRHCLAMSRSSPIIVQTDIADFYPRVYHHRVENALNRLPAAGDVPSRLMKLLGAFSRHVSYGLPVGGPASRILSELALNSVDFLLERRGIKFCRYADDYVLFCADRADAYRDLVFLADKLANEGLVLQKKKTRILDSEEFRQASALLDPETDPSRARITDEQKLLNISIDFDPYSPTAEDDYENLKTAVEQVDILGILGREIAKTAIDPAVAKQAIQAVRMLDLPQRFAALRMLLDAENILILAPIFVTLMRLVRDLYPDLSPIEQDFVDTALIELSSGRSPMLSVDVNLAHYLQALAGNASQAKEEILIHLFRSTGNSIIRRLIILIMSRWKCYYWLSDVKSQYGAMPILEKRAFVLASYCLGDEGKHWRDHTRVSWGPPELLIRDWFAARFQRNKGVPV